MEELLEKSIEELFDMIKVCEVEISIHQAKINEIGAAISEKRRIEQLRNKLSGVSIEDLEKIKAQILSASPISSEESVHLN